MNKQKLIKTIEKCGWEYFLMLIIIFGTAMLFKDKIRSIVEYDSKYDIYNRADNFPDTFSPTN